MASDTQIPAFDPNQPYVVSQAAGPSSTQSAPVPPSATPTPAPQFDPNQPYQIESQTPPQSPEQPVILSRAWDATKQYGENIGSQASSAFHGVVDPPADHKEALANMFGGTPALVAYKQRKKVVAGVENSIKAKPDEFQQAVSDFQRGVQDFHNKDYRNLVSSAGSTTADIMGVTGDPVGIAARAREFSEGARPGGDLVTPTVKTALDVGTAALLERSGVGSEAEEEAAASKAPTTKTPGL